MGSRRLTGVVVVLASLLAAACGHSDDRSTVARPTTTGPTAPTPTVTANGPAVTTGPALALPASDDWPTYHHDPARRGSVAGGPSPAGVKQHWLSPALDGTVYAEPLVVDGLVIAATEGDSVYALHVDSGQVAWQAQLGQPMRASQLPCGNIDPSGITGTPVVDVATGTVYATAFLQPGRHELVALDLHSGQVKFRRAIDPPSDDPKVLQERGALQVANGMVYVPFGGLFGDCGSYHGWIVASRLDGQGPLQSFQVPVKREGGLWAPPGPSIDEKGNLYVALGNAEPSPGTDFGNSVLRLTPQLQLADFFVDPNSQALSASDTDLGSISPALLDGGLAFQAGKEGRGFLLRADQLGHQGGQAFAAPVCRAAFGGTAYAPPLLYVACVDGLIALRIQAGPSFAVAWRSTAESAGPAIVTGHAVWFTAPATGELVALDASSGQPLSRTRIGTMTRFSTPAAAGSQILVATGNKIAALGN